MALKFNYQVPILEKGLVDDKFIIRGTAISATTTSTHHTFLEEELDPAAKTLAGVPLLKNHTNEVESIMGRVLTGEWLSTEKRIEFGAHVIDKDMQKLINDGRLNSVSVGADVDNIEETEDGLLIPRGIKFRELSLVAVGADEGASFAVALKQAYDTQLEEQETFNCECIKCGYKLKSKEHCADIKCPKCGGTMRRAERPGPGQSQKLNIKPKGEVKMSKDENKEEKEETKEEEKEEKKEEKEEKKEEKAKGFTKEEVDKLISEAVTKAVKAVKEADKDEEEKKEDKEEKKEEKEKEEKKETEEEESEEESEEEKTEEKGNTFVQSHGSLKGGSFTLVRE